MPFPLDTFTFIIVAGYLLGALPWHARVRSQFLLAVLEVSEVLLWVFLARTISGPGMGVALAALAAISGLHWPPLRRAGRSPFYYFNWGRHTVKIERTLLLLTGPLLLTAPVVPAYLVALWLVSFRVTGYATLASTLTALAIAPLMWHQTGYDLWGIFGLLVTMIILYQQVPYLERLSRGREQSSAFSSVLTGRPDRTLRPSRVVRRTALLWRFVIIGGVAALLVLLVLNRFVYRGFGPQHAIFRHGNPSFRYIALTFDDGPDPKYTERILDILKANDVSATFFLVGDHVRSYPDLVRRMAADGHEIGNHTDTHRNLFLLPKRQTIAEIDNSAKSIAAVTAQRPRLFRPPRGLYDRALLSLLAERRNTLVLWSISSQDWAEVSPGGIRRNILSRVRGGDILLFHDSGAIVSAQGGDRDNTINALPKILSQLKARGFRLVTVSELYSITSLTGAR